jgi:hypothetical protein
MRPSSLFERRTDRSFEAAIPQATSNSPEFPAARCKIFGEDDTRSSRVLSVEQSNSSIVYGERFFRSCSDSSKRGQSDAEILRFLTERRGSRTCPHSAPWSFVKGREPHRSRWEQVSCRTR